MSEIYKEIIWKCPKCNNNNTDTFLDIETPPVQCKKCNNGFDVFVQAKLDVKVIGVGNIPYVEKDLNVYNDQSITDGIVKSNAIKVSEILEELKTMKFKNNTVFLKVIK